MPKMDKESASRIQSHADRSGDAKAKEFASRAQSAADRPENEDSEDDDE